MRVLTVCAMILAIFAVSCSSDPLKYRVDDKLINRLPGEKLVDAKKIKAEFLVAKKNWDVSKLKLKLYEMEMEAAVRYAAAAVFAVKATREKIALQNKGLKMDVEAGTLARMITESALAKKNLKYRKLLFELHESAVEHKFLLYHQLRADYFEKIVNIMHSAGDKKDIDKHRKSTYVRQAAERKTMVAEALEEVEKGMRVIKELEKEVKPLWAPSLSCHPTSAPAPDTQPETKPDPAPTPETKPDPTPTPDPKPEDK